MGIQDENNKDAKSKIEQIRIDLEKKLAAIEDSKKNVADVNDQEKVLKTELEELSSKISEVDNNTIEEVEEAEANPVFEISEPIIPVEPKVIKTEVVKKDADVFKENDIKEIEEDKKIIEKEEPKKVVSPPKTVIAAVEKKSDVVSGSIDKKIEELEEKIVEDEDKKSKKGALSFLIYGLLIGLFATIGYLYMDYTRENKSLEEEKMNQKLSEFKNKRYLDSIELADLNSQLEDLQSKKMLDSLDRVYEQELITNSKFKNKKAIQRNFDLASLKETPVKTSNTKSSKGANTVVNNSTVSNTATPQSNDKVVENTSSSIKNTNKNGVDVVDSNSANNKGNITSEATEIANAKVSEEIAKNSLENTNSENLAKNDNSKIVNKSSETVNNKKRTVKSPIYPGCEKKKTELDRKRCFTSKMYRHISRKFNTNLAQNIGLEEGIHQVRVQYIIDKAGYATVLNVRAENKKLEQEAIRVIQSLPKMTPGTIDGKRTKLQYNIPIKFAVNN